MSDIDVKKEKFEKGLKVAGGLGIILVFGLLLPLLVKGVLGLALAAVGFVAYHAWPVFSRFITNMKYKAIGAMARANPVETNRRIYEHQQTVLEARTEAIKRFAGKLANVSDTVDSLYKRFGDDEKVLKLKAARETMQSKLERLQAQLKRARRSQTEFAAEIEKAEAIWDATQQMIEVQRLSGSAADKAIEEFESQMAFKAINEEFNTAVAELDNETDDDFMLEGETAPAQLTTGSSKELPTRPHLVREPAPFPERESSAFPRDKTKEGGR